MSLVNKEAEGGSSGQQRSIESGLDEDQPSPTLIRPNVSAVCMFVRRLCALMDIDDLS